MKIEIADSYNELSLKAKNLVVQEIEKNKRLLLCTATGSSPTGMYQLLCTQFQENPELFEQLRIIKLDEWGGVAMDQPGTCEHYLQQNLLQPLQIPEPRYTGFNSNPENPGLECERIQDKLRTEGPIDLCILGIGLNGHLAFNEPADYLQPFCHVAELSEMTLQHAMASKMNFKPTYGFTLGMADILHSKMILILIAGKQKREIVQKLMSKQVSSSVPASFLWLHPNVYCLIEKDAFDETA
ncbi:MAG: galactosamine-6-phosphate isomerase [Bacteroidota bacterium]|nr:galactosamine-6-phosphate isomerase [Odoribacter sp.]MDP3642900.1 galactosamine-6-phosphate isomerase [Bacteroidota bacterium]